MNWQIPLEERTYLRELAKRQAELAGLPVMEERRKGWLALNDGLPGARPMIMVDNWTFDRDFMPESLYRCRTSEGKGIETQLLRSIRTQECIGDDKVVPATFDMFWFVNIDTHGVAIPVERVKDAQGYETGYHFLHPIKDLSRDIHLVKPVTCSVDRERTAAWKSFLEELLGDILPVTLRTGVMGATSLTQSVVRLMGMEAFFLAMYDAPEAVHALMARLRDNCLGSMRWAEAEGLLRVNNGNQNVAGSGFNFTAKLPAPGYTGPAARLCDMWASAESQETVGIAPDMFGEFCAPYYRAVCEPLGLVYWGCCEPASPLWEHIRTMPHLKKVSISRWCDENFMGDALRGTEIIYSRKPDPKFLGVDVTLDEEAWAQHIRRTLEAARGVGVEFAIRDVYTVHGNLDKVRRAVEIARGEIERVVSRPRPASR
jgi:hypothetical protein